MLSWAAAVFEVIGIWLIGNKNRWAFASFIICGIMWFIVGLQNENVQGLMFISVIGIVLNIRGWRKWQ